MSEQIAQIFPARLLVASERATVAQLTAAAKERAPDPAAFDLHDPLFWTTEASSNRLDAYKTFMGISTLKNFAEDAKRGIAFQDSHRTDGINRTFGQSLGARYIGPNAKARPEGVAAVEVDFYTLLGVDPAIDTFARKAQTGLARDVSVGFYDGWYRCTICDRDMRDYSDWQNYCPHYPGQKVAVLDSKTGKPTDERIVATAEIMDAHLAEVSTVYDGATPEASIIVVKAKELAEAGKLDPKEARFIQDRYRVNLPGVAPAFAVGIDLRAAPAAAPAKEATGMTLEEQLRELATELGIAEGADILGGIRTLATDTSARIASAVTARDEQVRGVLAKIGLATEEGDLLAGIRAHEGDLAALRLGAKDGVTYRQHLIDTAIAEGVRAFGSDKFKVEERKAALGALGLDEIVERTASWTEIGDQRHPGGRQTRDDDPTKLTVGPRPISPRAFRVGR